MQGLRLATLQVQHLVRVLHEGRTNWQMFQIVNYAMAIPKLGDVAQQFDLKLRSDLQGNSW
jgi:hypothetical protein